MLVPNAVRRLQATWPPDQKTFGCVHDALTCVPIDEEGAMAWNLYMPRLVTSGINDN